jgi:hypothetical protein
VVSHHRLRDRDAGLTKRHHRSMSDEDGPTLAKTFYQQLLKNDRLDLDDIAYALDEAICQLRDDGAPPDRWAAFVHMGG